MIRYEKRMFLGPLSTPPRWHLDGRTSPEGQPTAHRPVPRAEMSVAWNGRCCWMERSSGEEEAPITHAVPWHHLGSQTTNAARWFTIGWWLWKHFYPVLPPFLCIFGCHVYNFHWAEVFGRICINIMLFLWDLCVKCQSRAIFIWENNHRNLGDTRSTEGMFYIYIWQKERARVMKQKKLKQN